MTNDQRTLLQPAYVLHQRPYRETSALIEFITPQHGRVGAIAKGVHAKKSSLRGMLQSFTPLLVSWQGRGELKTLVHAEQRQSPLVLTGVALFSGLYLNELLMRVVPRFDEVSELFGDYENCLQSLGRNSGIEKTLRVFEKRLLQTLGYDLVLDADANSGLPIKAEENYVYVLEKGPVKTGLKEHNTFAGRTLIALANETLDDPQTLLEAKRLLRQCLAPLLGDKPLKSRELFRAFMNS